MSEFNRRLLVEVQRDGQVYLSNARIGHVFALRACIANHRTTERDVQYLLDRIRHVASTLVR